MTVKKRRIVTVSSPWGNYAIQEQRKRFWLFPYWYTTHVYVGLRSAIDVLEWKNKKERNPDPKPVCGVVVYGEGYKDE